MLGGIHELDTIQKAFFDVKKPGHFCDFRHCAECEEHDRTLRSHTRDSISFNELGNPGWDPICFVNTNQGFQYYLPALARLSLCTGDEYYLSQFIFHLNRDRINGLNQYQRFAIASFLEALIERIPDEIEANLDGDETLGLITKLYSSDA